MTPRLVLGGLLGSLSVLASHGAYADDRALLRDYAFVICLSSAYEAGGADYRVAGKTLKSQAWWFVEHTAAKPETYDRLFSAAAAFGAALPAETAAVGCSKWRNGEMLTKLLKE